MKRMEESRLSRSMEELVARARRPRGRPGQVWVDEIRKGVKGREVKCRLLPTT